MSDYFAFGDMTWPEDQGIEEDYLEMECDKPFNQQSMRKNRKRVIPLDTPLKDRNKAKGKMQ